MKLRASSENERSKLASVGRGQRRRRSRSVAAGRLSGIWHRRYRVRRYRCRRSRRVRAAQRASARGCRCHSPHRAPARLTRSRPMRSTPAPIAGSSAPSAARKPARWSRCSATASDGNPCFRNSAILPSGNIADARGARSQTTRPGEPAKSARAIRAQQPHSHQTDRRSVNHAGSGTARGLRGSQDWRRSATARGAAARC